MISRKLQRARDFENKYGPAAARELPRFHVTGRVGWINDPNGFAPYQGEYHLFYQYHPYDTKWGPMHWGHVKTKDFIRWERLPVALAPDTDYDKDGCFSGGAVELPDGRHLLMYTGVKNSRRRDGRIESRQTQCIAIGDGVNYEKYPGNPVIDSRALPQGGSPADFRDPHIWRENGVYRAVAVNRTPDGSGAVLLYESEDALHWRFVSTLAASRNQYGRMWECPDFFSLNGTDVLIVAPQEVQAVGLEFHPGNANMAMLGHLDRQTNQLVPDAVQALDYGLDFYAPQSLLTADGRRVMIGWMQNWETCGCHLPDQRFMGMMTIPRELTIRNGRLCQNPVRELERYRANRVVYRQVTVQGDMALQSVQGRYLDLTVNLAVTPEFRWFQMTLAGDGTHYTALRYCPASGLLRLDRTYSGLPCDIVNIREFAVRPRDGKLKLRLILDRYSVELFVNDGEQAASAVIYTPLEAAAIRFSCDGTAVMDVEKYDILEEEQA